MALQTTWNSERLFADLPRDPARSVCNALTGLWNTSGTLIRDQVSASLNGGTVDRCIRAMACVCRSWRQHPIVRALISALDARILRQVHLRKIEIANNLFGCFKSFRNLVLDLNIPLDTVRGWNVDDPSPKGCRVLLLETRISARNLLSFEGGGAVIGPRGDHVFLGETNGLWSIYVRILHLSARLFSFERERYGNLDPVIFSALTNQHPLLRISPNLVLPPSPLRDRVNQAWARMNALTITAIAFLANWVLRR